MASGALRQGLRRAQPAGGGGGGPAGVRHLAQDRRGGGGAVLTDVYAYPNPALRSRKPTIHVEAAGALEMLEVRIYDVSGSKVHDASLPVANGVATGGVSVYEYVWDDGNAASGVYLYVVEAIAEGGSARAAGKLALVR